ncbi:MAG: radical SAM protein [Acidocella sp.]|nr:radical SAM protein [Acidocella sp.]
MNLIERLRAPLFVSWQMTRACDLACLHCCTDSAPGKKLPNELTADEAMRLAADIVANGVPYVMLCGGEPLIVPHFFEVAEFLGRAGIQLKIETNGQLFDAAVAKRLAKLPIRSVQISLDGDTQNTYERQRPGASLAKAHAACRAVREAGLPLEVTFAPTRLNMHEAEAVIARAQALGAFRCNTGMLMNIGRAAKLWPKIAATPEAYQTFKQMLDIQAPLLAGSLEICYNPFTVEAGLQLSLETPPATMLILPNGMVKIAAAIGCICADLRRISFTEAWENYCAAWHDDGVIGAIERAITDSASHAEANVLTFISNGEFEKCLT